MNFSNFREIMIPEGRVIKIIDSNANIIWQEQVKTLPEEYQQVDWIQAANGVGAYLDLGFTFDKAALIKIGIYCDSLQTSGQIFGAAENNGKLRCMITAPFSSASTASFYGSTGSTYNNKTYGMTSGKNEFEFSLKKGEMRIVRKDLGTIATETSQGEYTMTSNLLLFGQNYNGTVRYAGLRKVYYFKYYDANNNLICDLVPCYRKADQTIGMYDTVRNIFLTNAGSGYFTRAIPGELGYTNLVNIATADIGGTTLFEGSGCGDGWRWSLSGNAIVEGGKETRVTGWIPYKSGSVLRIQGFSPKTPGYVTDFYLVLGDASGTVKTYVYKQGGTYDYTYDSAKDIITLTTISSSYTHFRVSGYVNQNGVPPAITLDEVID